MRGILLVFLFAIIFSIINYLLHMGGTVFEVGIAAYLSGILVELEMSLKDKGVL